MEPVEAARFGFLLGIPAIAGAGLLSAGRAASDGTGITAAIVVGTVVAGLIGYLAIALLIRALQRVGLGPFGLYCVTVGAVALAVL
jgi:undecaprenyl-diphosphatase